MLHAPSRVLRAATPAALLAAASLLAGPASPATGRAIAPTTGQAPVLSPAATSSGTAPLLLITGQRLVVPPGSHGAVAIEQAPNDRFAFTSLVTGCSQALKLPAAALPFLGRGLDPSLFQVSALQRAESGGRLPVRLLFSGGRPAVPGITITRSGPGAASGYLTAASARVFGHALRRQFAADQKSGRYGADGMFAGGLSIRLAGAPVPRRLRPHFPQASVTVTGTTLSGQPDTGGLMLLFNLDDCHKLDVVSAENSFFHGTAKFSVPTGHYWGVAEFGVNRSTRLVVVPQFSVTRNTRLHVSARDANSRVLLKTARTSVPGNVNFTILRTSHGVTGGVSWLTAARNRLWISTLRQPPSLGTLNSSVGGEFVSPSNAPGLPYTYDLDIPAPPGTIPVPHVTVPQADLATVHERFYKDTKFSNISPSFLGGWALVGGTRQEINSGLSQGLFYVTNMPGRRTVYLSATPAEVWVTIASPYLVLPGILSPLRLVHAGEQLDGNWSRYPLHPGAPASLPGAELSPVVPAASRAGNTLRLSIEPFVDNQPGDTSAGYASCIDFRLTCRGQFALFQNGTRIAAGNAVKASLGHDSTALLVQAGLSPKPALLRLVVTASRAGSGPEKNQPYILSATSRDVWTWRTHAQPGATVPSPWRCIPATLSQPARGHQCAAQDLTTLNYDVAGLGLTGSAEPGHQQVTITAQQIQLAPVVPITRASVQISFNGGRTWHRATVSKLSDGHFRAGFSAPGGVKVSLRTHAAGAAGTSVTETITGAYRTAEH